MQSTSRPNSVTLSPIWDKHCSVSRISEYLFFVGIYSSALSVANDAELRRIIKKSVEEKSNLLADIGAAQTERQLQDKVLKVTKDAQDMIEGQFGIESSLGENDLENT